MKPLFALAFAAALALEGFGGIHAAPGVDAVTPPGAKCDMLKEIANVYGGDRAVVYRLSDSAVPTIVDFFQYEIFNGAPPPAPISAVWLGIDMVDNDVGFFFMGTDGCGVTDSFGWSTDDAALILDAIGLPVPFGSTYHQIPGTPGGLPGTNI